MLTATQSAALFALKCIRDAQVRDLLSRYPGCTPSRAVSGFVAKRHGIGRATLGALVKKGYVTAEATDGSGTEYTPVSE